MAKFNKQPGGWNNILLAIIAVGVFGIILAILSRQPPPAASAAAFPPPIGGLPPSIPTRFWGAGINPDIRNTQDIFNDPYIPPVKTESRTYRQLGILTSNNNTLILPLLGRKHINGRDKYNYYTISNTGAINTKLPIRVKGKSCTNEYGCDEVFTGDIVVVDGYDAPFKATIYENNSFSYMDSI